MATGRTIEMTGMEITRLHDGKIVELWHAENGVGLLMPLGVIPPPPAPPA